MNAISLDSAIIVTEISKRTLWRRLTDGQITRMENDERGRAMLAFEDLIPLLAINVDPVDYELFMAADAGNAHAQNDLALLFLEADKPEIAFYWLQSAVSSQQSAVSSQQSAWMRCTTLPSFISRVSALRRMRTPGSCGWLKRRRMGM